MQESKRECSARLAAHMLQFSAGSASSRAAVIVSSRSSTRWREPPSSPALYTVCSRGTLKYTYVFAYYLKKNNECVIFEANQKDLEMATETLSEYLEGKAKDAELSALRQMVMDKTKYCEKRRHVLLEHVREVGVRSRLSCLRHPNLIAPPPPGRGRQKVGLPAGGCAQGNAQGVWLVIVEMNRVVITLLVTCAPRRHPWDGPAACGSDWKVDIL